jgi:hypothetical protein
MSAVCHILPLIAASGHPLISGSKNYGRTGDKIALCGCMMQQQHIADKIKKSSEKRVCGDAR